MTKKRRIGFIVFSMLMIVSLLALGSWQVQRMNWKAGLIEQSERALTAKPVSINDINAGIEYGYNVDWLRIKLNGTYLHDLERYMYTPTKDGIGYQVITPFLDEAGVLVFVDRGWISTVVKDQKERKDYRLPSGKINITGVTRVHDVNLKLFLADPDIKNNVWYWYDRETLAKSLPAGIGETPDGQLPIISLVFVQLEPGGDPQSGALPKTGPVRIELPNHHLQYAITWFSLAVIMAVMLFFFLRANKPKEAEI